MFWKNAIWENNEVKFLSPEPCLNMTHMCIILKKQEVSGALGVCLLNLQIVWEKLKSLTRPHDKRDVILWKEVPYSV